MQKKLGRVEDMLRALQEFGPMTSVEICAQIGTTKSSSGAILGRLMRQSVTKPKRVYILDWTYDSEGARRYPRPIYAVGDKKDKPMPKASPAENQRRYKQKKSKMVNSVFQLGVPIKMRFKST
jgi:hypothetical protein